jgi:hypothetical protein
LFDLQVEVLPVEPPPEGGEDEAPSSVSGPVTRFPPPKKLCAALAVASVSMCDVGTEMTPIVSQEEQSGSGTPTGAATPSLSPLYSVLSIPRYCSISFPIHLSLFSFRQRLCTRFVYSMLSFTRSMNSNKCKAD